MQRRFASPASSQLGRHSLNEEQVEDNRYPWFLCRLSNGLTSRRKPGSFDTPLDRRRCLSMRHDFGSKEYNLRRIRWLRFAKPLRPLS